MFDPNIWCEVCGDHSAAWCPGCAACTCADGCDPGCPTRAYQHTPCCAPATGVCGAPMANITPASLDLPYCPDCADLLWAVVPCSLGCPFTTAWPAALGL